MQVAYLYVRVSTDEQAIKGYSQRSQVDRLVRYCIAREVMILDTIFEDHSAKSFDRPAWSSMMKDIRRNKRLRPDLILFTKWDRFSRNTGDAYYMITQLRNLGISPQAIDQELDLSIPENKIILGVYLATSEAENDRRSLNVRQGIHKALQEGRWTAHVPIGYKSHIAPDGKRMIIPKEPEATFIKRAFNWVAENRQNVESIYIAIISKGLKCSRSNFRRLLRNPVYCGKVSVPAFENESSYLTRGLHEPLISPLLFSQVQDILNNVRRKQIIHHNYLSGPLILRGFLLCPVCNKRLTGSASTGKKGKRYYYYHCSSPCGFRTRSDRTNNLLLQQIEQLRTNEEYQTVFESILKHISKGVDNTSITEEKSISRTIDKLIERIVKAKELLLIGEIDEDDYRLIKRDCESKIHLLGFDLQRVEKVAKRNSKSLKKAKFKLAQFGQTFCHMSIHDRHKLLNFVLCPGIVLEPELRLDKLINEEIGILFGLTCINRESSYSPVHYHESIDFGFYQDTILKIAKIVEPQGSIDSMDKGQISRILDFLIIFAKIISK